jgi:integrase
LVELPVKSDTSGRVVYLDEPIIDMLHALRVHQTEQGLKLGQQWDGKGFVFCRVDGAPFDPAYVSRDFTARMKAAGLAGLTLHDLRHTNVSGTIASSGLKTASERAGHSSVQITGDIYGHVEPEQQRAAARKFTEYMAGGA